MEIKRLHSRWDGSYKSLTKNCIGCDYYTEIEDMKLCGWGVAFKILDETEAPRKCFLKIKEPPQYASIKYLDKIEEEGLFVTEPILPELSQLTLFQNDTNMD